MSGQHCENYDVKRETVHCYPRDVDLAGVSVSFSKFAFFLFCYVTNHLMTGPEGNSEFCLSRILMLPLTSSRKTLRFSGNKIHCSPRDQSLSVKCVICGYPCSLVPRVSHAGTRLLSLFLYGLLLSLWCFSILVN